MNGVITLSELRGLFAGEGIYGWSGDNGDPDNFITTT